MIPLVDMHVHLLAGLDDGPRTAVDAVEMCRLAYAEGIRMAAATAHQNEHWNANSPERIRQAVQRLAQDLRAAGLPLMVFANAEVMAQPDLEAAWQKGKLLSVGDRQQFLLLEMPHRLFVDLRAAVQRFAQMGVRVILAHPERHEELLHEPGQIEQLIRLGCLVQVSSDSITDPPSRRDSRALRSWFQRGVVHLLGSDGHSPRRRPPRMAAAYEQVRRWAGNRVADRVCSTNGMAVLQGLPLRVPEPEPRGFRWLARFW